MHQIIHLSLVGCFTPARGKTVQKICEVSGVKRPTYFCYQHPYSSILTTCPNHLNTLGSTLLANSIFIPALLGKSSLLTLYILDIPTYLLKHFISKKKSLSFSQHFSCPMHLLRPTPLVKLLHSYRHFAFYLNPLLFKAL